MKLRILTIACDFFTWRNEFKAGGWYLSGLPQAQVDGPPCQTNGP